MDERDLVVKYKKLYSDGNLLVDSSGTILGNINNINSMLSKEWNSWLGNDSDTYVASLKDTLKTLMKYSSEINHIGSYIRDIAEEYESALLKGMEELNSDE